MGQQTTKKQLKRFIQTIQNTETPLSNQNPRTFEGQFFFFQGQKTTEFSSAVSVEYTFLLCKTHVQLEKTENCTRRPPPRIISRFENEAANTHGGGDLRRNCPITFRYVLRVFHSHCHINKYEKHISRLI